MLLPFTKPHIQSHIIADSELLPVALRVVCLVEVVAPGAIPLLVSGDTIALSWIATEKARHGEGMELLRVILAYLGKNKMRVRGMYACTYHNATCVMMNREKLAEIQQWAETEKFERGEPGQACANFLSTMRMGEDWYVTDLIPGFPVDPWVSYGLAVGWDPSS